MDTEIRHPTSAVAWGKSVMVGTDTGLVLRFDARDLERNRRTPAHMVDVTAVLGEEVVHDGKAAPVYVLSAGVHGVVVACNGVYVTLRM